jgi:hypothetical protein
MLRRLALPLTAAVCLVLPTAAQAKQVVLGPANNTGETLELVQDNAISAFADTGQSNVDPTETGLDDGALANGVRAELTFATDGCGSLCDLIGAVSFGSPRSPTTFTVSFTDPAIGSNTAKCTSSTGIRCDISYNASGADLLINTNVYAAGYDAAPEATVSLDAHPLHPAGQVLRSGVPVRLQASRAGRLVTRLVPLSRQAASAAAVHGRLHTRVTSGGTRFDRRVRLNRAGRRAVRRLGLARYRLVTVFTDQDGVRTRQSRRIAIARP